MFEVVAVILLMIFVGSISTTAYLVTIPYIEVARIAAGRRKLELPEWTGRERESLRADLEAAITPDYPWDSWEQIKQKDAESNLSGYLIAGAIENTAASHGLFPEALEAFIEKQE